MDSGVNWTPVKSSNIAALAHNGEGLLVEFTNGNVYHYANVPLPIYSDILSAASVGRTFNQLIKSKPDDYPFTRVVH